VTCKLCTERGKTWNGDDPRCAFESGVFSTDNWRCATMSRLRGIAEKRGSSERDDNSCASIGYVPLDNDYVPMDAPEMDAGYIVMTWYKDRGRKGQALIMWDDEESRPLTLREAEEAIRVYELNRKRSALNVRGELEEAQ